MATALKVAFVCGCIYALLKWDIISLPNNESTAFAEQACADAIDERFDASSVSVYSINESHKGYVARASITLARGNTARVYCLTNEFGGVEEIRIEER